MKDRFAGVWIGESVRPEPRPALLWRITHVGQHVFVYPRSEASTADEGYYSGTVADDSMSFSLYGVPAQRGVANVLDADHFYIAGWDADGDGDGAFFDVIFSRPGLPELCARKLWQSAKTLQDARRKSAQRERVA